MLVANRKNGQKLSLIEKWPKKALMEIRKKESFTCPGCHEPVVLKIGEKKIPHFAHLSSSHCPSFSEKESQYHLNGKLQLFTWLKDQQLAVEIEPYLSNIQQRPDILLSYKNKKYAIEFQCSTIPLQLFMKRTKAYIESSYTPLWILAASKLQRKSTYSFKASPFIWLYTQTLPYQNIPTILIYCPEEMQLLRLSSITSFTPTDLIASLSITPISNFTFSNLLIEKPTNIQIPDRIWFQKKQKWRISVGSLKTVQIRKFLQELYYHRIPPIFIPCEAGIPINSSYWIETPMIIWQMYILMDSIIPSKIGETITFKSAYMHFNNRRRQGLINIRTLPLMTETHFSYAIMEYLQCLAKLGVIKKVSGSTFIKIRDIIIYDRIEDQVIQEKAILNFLR